VYGKVLGWGHSPIYKKVTQDEWVVDYRLSWLAFQECPYTMALLLLPHKVHVTISLNIGRS